MPLNVFQSSVSLIHTTVFHIGGVFSANQMPIHNTGFSQYIGGLIRRRVHLHHNPKQRRRHETKNVTESVQEVSLKCSIVRWGYNYELLSRHEIEPLCSQSRTQANLANRRIVVAVRLRRLDLKVEVVARNNVFAVVVVVVAEGRKA